jgi:hypothetical protein
VLHEDGIDARWVCDEVWLPHVPGTSRKDRAPPVPRTASQYLAPEVTVAARTETVFHAPDLGEETAPAVSKLPGCPFSSENTPAMRVPALADEST